MSLHAFSWEICLTSKQYYWYLARSVEHQELPIHMTLKLTNVILFISKLGLLNF